MSALTEATAIRIMDAAGIIYDGAKVAAMRAALEAALGHVMAEKRGWGLAKFEHPEEAAERAGLLADIAFLRAQLAEKIAEIDLAYRLVLKLEAQLARLRELAKTQP